MLIPYTTKEDYYHYYETRNYVNDVNRKHTQVLQTYDDHLNKRESYSYGYGRSRYTNETSGDSYNYLTNRSGSVTGLTQNGQSVASSSCGIYGSSQQTTDTTGNPFAYNGEARDVTGLDYLRARYYDSRAGSFLTADSYLGNQTDPLSQNLYTYVQNNPVNYTDPSGHKKNWFQRAWDHTKQVARNVYNAGARFVKDPIGTIKNVSRNILNVAGNIGRAIGNIGRTALNIGRSVGSWVTQQISRSLSSQSSYINSSSYVDHQRSQAQAQVIAQLRYQQQVTREFTQATGIKGTPKTREAQNLFKNWSNDLKDMYKHVCTTAERWKDAGVNFAKNIDWKNVLKTSAYIAGEFFSVNDIYRVVTGTDPLTGEKASRLEAAAWLAADILTLGSSKVGKVAKIATKANKLVDMVKSSKVVSRANKFVDVAKASQTASKVNKVVDSSKTFIKSNVNKLLDTPLGFSPQLVGASGRTINAGGTTFREMGQNAKKGFDNLVQAFVKNGDEIAQGSGKPNLTKFIIMLLIGVKPILQRWKE